MAVFSNKPEEPKLTTRQLLHIKDGCTKYTKSSDENGQNFAIQKADVVTTLIFV